MADQGGVWAQLADRASELAVDSPTGAMRDLYSLRQEHDRRPAKPGRPAPAPRSSAAPGPASARAMWLVTLAERPDPSAGWTPALSSRRWPRARSSPRRRWAWARSIASAPSGWLAPPWWPRGVWLTSWRFMSRRPRGVRR
jgi:hypothetical protein